jgi:hypothetical protein
MMWTNGHTEVWSLAGNRPTFRNRYKIAAVEKAVYHRALATPKMKLNINQRKRVLS